MMKTRCYTELMNFKTFDERFRYLMLNGKVGEETFGLDRYLNQVFYRTKRWKRIRDEVIIRDLGCDLGVEGYDIDRIEDKYYKGGKKAIIIVHHMNPLTVYDIENETKFLIDPEYLITTSLNTHNAIHYGNELALNSMSVVERKPFDTCPWRH